MLVARQTEDSAHRQQAQYGSPASSTLTPGEWFSGCMPASTALWSWLYFFPNVAFGVKKDKGKTPIRERYLEGGDARTPGRRSDDIV